ncbi:MAG: sigma-70 family RNA polymerase sigma factor [Thermodesulfobacteriota bacterium]|nr:MAG: sigma-70 family RNA polymerase sigma factor [Thermodesulfobacteriota bacterium]
MMSNKSDHVYDDDVTFISRCQKGDTEAFGVLVERYQKKMFNIAFRMTGDYEAAGEVVQEAFLSAFRAIKTFRGEATFATWLTTIVLNHAKNSLKKTRVISHYEPISLDQAADPHNETPRFDPPADSMSAMERLEKKDIQEVVQEAINSLDTEFREILILKDIQEVSYEEITAILKIPDGTVKSRIFRAREALRERLKRKLGDW